MSWVTAGTTVLSVGSSLLGGSSQKKAQKKAQQEQERAYGRQQEILAPYTNAGSQAVNQLSALNAGDYSGFESSPDYRYAKQEMSDSVDSNAAANGTLYSGGHTVDLSRNINGLASQNLGNYSNRLIDVANMGSNAASSMSNATGQYGQSASQTALATGDTNSQTIGAVGSGLSSLGGNLLTQMGAAGSGSGTTTGTVGANGAGTMSQWGQQMGSGQGSNLNFGNNLTNMWGNGYYGWNR